MLFWSSLKLSRALEARRAQHRAAGRIDSSSESDGLSVREARVVASLQTSYYPSDEQESSSRASWTLEQ